MDYYLVIELDNCDTGGDLMKVFRKEDIEIDEGVGSTVFYTITESQLLKHYDADDNYIVRYIVSENGFDAFEIDNMYGSKLIGDILYLCVTDGNDIIVNGEEIFPEDALDMYDISALSAYIQPGDDDVIDRYVSTYELKPIDINDVAPDILDQGAVDFTEVVEWAKELDLLD